MRLTLATIATALLLVDDASATWCVKNYKANTCLRSVVGAIFGKDRAYHDCDKYLRVTVTPRASTTTTTVVLPTTTVSTTVTTTITTVDESTTDSTQTNYISETSTVYEETTTTIETEYAVKTVEAGNVQVRNVEELEGRNAVPAKEKEYPAYASACGSFEKYSSACRCIGSWPRTTTAPRPTVTSTCTEYSTTVSTHVVTETSTDINYIPVTETVEETTYIATETIWEHTATRTTTEYTATVTSVVRNGGFESGDFSRWTASKDNKILSSVTTPGNRKTKWLLATADMNNNRLLEIYQVTQAVAGQRYKCVYDWKFNEYYERFYVGDPIPEIPYVHVYLNSDTRYTDWVSPDENTKGTWQTSEFYFTSVKGNDKLWFDCASPQKPKVSDGGGPNKLYLDSIACYPA